MWTCVYTPLQRAVRTSVWTCVQAYTYPSILINGVDMRIHTLAERGVGKRADKRVDVRTSIYVP
jgi:hypothetical protein